jgi:hypothetical protein
MMRDIWTNTFIVRTNGEWQLSLDSESPEDYKVICLAIHKFGFHCKREGRMTLKEFASYLLKIYNNDVALVQPFVDVLNKYKSDFDKE